MLVNLTKDDIAVIETALDIVEVRHATASIEFTGIGDIESAENSMLAAETIRAVRQRLYEAKSNR